MQQANLSTQFKRQIKRIAPEKKKKLEVIKKEEFKIDEEDIQGDENEIV
jgi:hypothetical protein